MSTLNLPEPIAAYFAADKLNPEAVARCFTACFTQDASHTAIQCTIPAGVGRMLSFSVWQRDFTDAAHGYPLVPIYWAPTDASMAFSWPGPVIYPNTLRRLGQAGRRRGLVRPAPRRAARRA